MVRCDDPDFEFGPAEGVLVDAKEGAGDEERIGSELGGIGQDEGERWREELFGLN